MRLDHICAGPRIIFRFRGIINNTKLLLILVLLNYIIYYTQLLTMKLFTISLLSNDSTSS